jgi:diguanylate cyclase (GGDEF)-like protein
MPTHSAFRSTVRTESDAKPARAHAWQQDERSDPGVAARLIWVERGCLVVVTLVALTVLCGWIVPIVDSRLPVGWAAMKVNTALMLLMSAASLAFSRSSGSPRKTAASRLLGILVFALAAAILAEYVFQISPGVDTLLAADSGSQHPGRSAPQTALTLLLLALVLIFIRVRKGPLALVIDAAVFSLCPLVMVIVSGYAYGVLQLFGVSPGTRTAPHTLLALILLTFVAFARRAERGFLSILLGMGIGSRIARVAAPVALAVPFVLEIGRMSVAQTRWLTAEYSTALATAAVGVMGFTLVLVLARRIDGLEQDIRDLSLRDDLTNLYNRRGFLLLAERELRLTRRALVPFSVLFVDLDGLKQINDSSGHEVGSDFLREMAAMLRRCFREADVIGRIGGDEFVVAGVTGEAGMKQASERLEQAAAARNSEPGHVHRLNFSLGYATSEPGVEEEPSESLEAILNRADAAMYVAKRSKRPELSR